MALPFESLLEDNFSGVTIEIEPDDPMSTNDFYPITTVALSQQLTVTVSQPGPSVARACAGLSAHLSMFSGQEKAGVWLRLPLAVSHFVPAAVALGFEYHHAKSDYCLMSCWLPVAHPQHTPPPCTHLCPFADTTSGIT